MICKNCNIEFHYCSSCGEDGYSEYGFCSWSCKDEYANTKCKHEKVQCLDCGKWLEN